MNPSSPKLKILVTGGCGFIGGHLVCALMKLGHEVKVLDLLPPEAKLEGVTYLQGDVRNPLDLKEAVSGVNAVFHFAAIVSVTICQNEPLASTNTNLLGTLNVVQAVRAEQVRRDDQIRIILASSSAVYGNETRANEFVSEERVSVQSSSFYAIQKLNSEKILQVWCGLYGIPALSFRFFNVYGEGQDSRSPYAGVIVKFLKDAKETQPLQLHGGGIQTRDFIHVSDVVSACVAALDLPFSECLGLPINIGTGRSISIRELARIVNELTQNQEKVQDAAARIGDVLHSRANPERAKRLLHWIPKMMLEEGLRNLLQ